MGHLSRTGRYRAHGAVAAALMFSTAAVCAQGVPIDDEDLAGIWGQAMFSVDNRNADIPNGVLFDFTRITLNADLKLNANFSNITAGPTGAPVINIGDLRFVSSNADSLPYVQLADPYLELVYKNQSGSAALADREIIGARFGFGKITGNLGTLFNTLRGNIVIENGLGAGSDAGVLSLNQAVGASSNFACTGSGSGCVNGLIAMSKVGQVEASGASDFFVSILTQPVANFGDASGNTAPDGIAVNWTKGLTYKDLSGTVMPNPLPALSKRQGG